MRAAADFDYEAHAAFLAVSQPETYAAIAAGDRRADPQVIAAVLSREARRVPVEGLRPGDIVDMRPIINRWADRHSRTFRGQDSFTVLQVSRPTADIVAVDTDGPCYSVPAGTLVLLKVAP